MTEAQLKRAAHAKFGSAARARLKSIREDIALFKDYLRWMKKGAMVLQAHLAVDGEQMSHPEIDASVNKLFVEFLSRELARLKEEAEKL